MPQRADKAADMLRNRLFAGASTGYAPFRALPGAVQLLSRTTSDFGPDADGFLGLLFVQSSAYPRGLSGDYRNLLSAGFRVLESPELAVHSM
jgi:hypothetical protein